jgi:hypothetical protein
LSWFATHTKFSNNNKKKKHFSMLPRRRKVKLFGRWSFEPQDWFQQLDLATAELVGPVETPPEETKEESVERERLMREEEEAAEMARKAREAREKAERVKAERVKAERVKAERVKAEREKAEREKAEKAAREREAEEKAERLAEASLNQLKEQMDSYKQIILEHTADLPDAIASRFFNFVQSITYWQSELDREDIKKDYTGLNKVLEEHTAFMNEVKKSLESP